MEIIPLNCQEGEPPAKFRRISPDGDKRLNADIENLSVSSGKKSKNVEKQRAQENVIDKLDYDCLAKVLTYIPPKERLEMEKVCEKWKEATKLSWSNVKKFFQVPSFSTHEKLKILDNCCQYLTHLKLYNLPSELYEIIKNKCHNIIYFTIYTQYNETYENIRQIITSMSKLKYLHVTIDTSSVIDPCIRLFDSLLESLPNNMEEIYLKYNYLTARTTKNLHLVLPNNFSSLRRLELRGFILPNTTINSILLNKNTLIHLNLSECKFPIDSSSMFSNLHNLEQLKLNLVRNLNADAIIHIAHNCSKLKHFDFRINDYYDDDDDDDNDDDGPKDIPYRVFRELKYLNNLQHLSISNVIETTVEDGESFISCIGNNSELEALKIGTKFFGNSVIDFKEIKKLKKLKYLNYGVMNSQQLIDIASNCVELKTFNTSLGKDISGVALEKLANLEKLEGLRFYKADNLTDDVLIKIMSGCKNLRSLDIDNCKNITGDAFIHFEKLKYLRRLTISKMANIPNAMFNNLQNLEYLTCIDCPSLTDEDIIKVIDNCQKLRNLYLSKTGVTNKFLLHKSAKPRLAYGKLYITVDKSLKIDDLNIPDGSLPHYVSYKE